MNHFPRYINVVDTVEVDGCYLEEKRHLYERRKTLKPHFYRYERRLCKHRRHPVHLDIQA